MVIKNATRSKTPAGNIDLLVLRSRLAEQADNLLIEHLTKGAWRLGLILALAITVAGWMVVEALRRMPG